MDKDLAIMLTTQSTKILELEIRARVLSDVLVESKAITADELEEKYKTIDKKYYSKMRADIVESLERLINDSNKAT